MRLTAAGRSLKNYLATLAKADFGRVYNACPSAAGNHQPIDQHENRFSKIDVEQRLRSRKLEDLCVLKQSVEPALPEFKQSGLNCISRAGGNSFLLYVP